MVWYNILESLPVVECKLIGCVGVSLSLKIVVHSKKLGLHIVMKIGVVIAGF